MGFLNDFKSFAMRGNVIDMAVGIVIGTAFGGIVSSLVADMIMPAVGILLGGMDFTDFSVTMQQAVGDKPAVVLPYGKFIQTIINFLIISFSVFLFVKMIAKLQKKKEETPAPPITPVITKEQELLAEIRDLLKKER